MDIKGYPNNSEYVALITWPLQNPDLNSLNEITIWRQCLFSGKNLPCLVRQTHLLIEQSWVIRYSYSDIGSIAKIECSDKR